MTQKTENCTENVIENRNVISTTEKSDLLNGSETQKQELQPNPDKEINSYYLIRVEGDPEFRLSAKSARKNGKKAEFLPVGWVYQNKKDAEEIAKRWTQGKRKVHVDRWIDQRLGAIWNGSKDEARLAKKSIACELKRYQANEEGQKIEQEFEAKGLHRSWLYDTTSCRDYKRLNDREKETYNYYKPLWDKTFEDIALREADLAREEEDFNEKKIPNNIRYGNFVIKDKGLFYDPEEKDDDEAEIKISSPIWPEAYLRDKEGKSHTLLIKIHDGEKDHKIAIPRRVITKWAELSEILLDLGQSVPTSPTNQKHLQNFLMQARPTKLMRCVDKSGWHGDQYIFPDGEVLGKTKDNNENVHPINEVCPKGIEQKGSFQEWQDNVLKLCADNSRLIFSIGVSLSAPCLQLVGDEGCVFNFKGVSSIGKTRCLMVAISVFGSPEFKRSWRTTSNGLEGICSLHNDCLLALDEFGQSDAKEVGEIAYMYSQGIGKQRSSRDGTPREPKTWRGNLFSTGEVGISDHMQDDRNKPKAGQLVRVIDIPAQIQGAFGCFEKLHGLENGSDGERFADKIKEVCGEYYGTAGREFIKAMIESGLEKSKKNLKFSRDDFAANVAGKYDGQVKRVANRFGLVYAALSLGIELGVLSKDLTKEMAENAVKHCFHDWLNDRGTTGNFESHSIINQVLGLLNENSDSKFIPKNDVDDKRIRTTLWGYKDGAIFYVFPKAFKESLCKGFDEQNVKTILKDAGLLIPGKKKASQTIRIPAHSKIKKDRFYVIDLDKTQDDEEDTTC